MAPFMGNICYGEPTDGELKRSLDGVVRYVSKIYENSVLHGRKGETATSDLVDFINVVTQIKHYSFEEESECRIIVFGATEKYRKEAADYSQSCPVVAVKYVTRRDTLVPFVDFFDGRGKTQPNFCLPIKRIIVGPHKDKDLRKKKLVTRLEANGIAVDVSDIPYVGF